MNTDLNQFVHPLGTEMSKSLKTLQGGKRLITKDSFPIRVDPCASVVKPYSSRSVSAVMSISSSPSPPSGALTFTTATYSPGFS